jgi:hypothetical protein
MPTVELVYDRDCPNVARARANLLLALVETGVARSWSEHRIGDPDVPERVHGFGSPTVLVDGRDVAGVEPGSAACCRVYAENGAASGAPPARLIAAALEASQLLRQP